MKAVVSSVLIINLMLFVADGLTVKHSLMFADDFRVTQATQDGSCSLG